jgi:hypothetical protein
VISGMVLLSATAFAGGPADRVTGHFSVVACCPIAPDPIVRYREFFAWEESAESPQRGYMYSINDFDRWYQVDFGDMENSCVNVYEEGMVRLGGLVSDGNVGAVGRYFGFELQDWNQGPYHHASSRTFRFVGPGGPDDSEPARENLMHWCLTGEYQGRVNAIWPAVVVQGDLKIHNSKADGD